MQEKERKHRGDPAAEQKNMWPILGVALFAAYHIFFAPPIDPSKDKGFFAVHAQHEEAKQKLMEHMAKQREMKKRFYQRVEEQKAAHEKWEERRQAIQERNAAYFGH